VLALKANGTYDQYVEWHMNAGAAAHAGPAFFPWHREFLRRLELDLQAINPTRPRDKMWRIKPGELSGRRRNSVYGR
jgi:hypothetical protein